MRVAVVLVDGRAHRRGRVQAQVIWALGYCQRGVHAWCVDVADEVDQGGFAFRCETCGVDHGRRGQARGDIRLEELSEATDGVKGFERER